MFSFLGTVFFLILFFLLFVLLIGVNFIRSLFKRNTNDNQSQTSSTSTRHTPKEEKQRLKHQFKEEGQYVDYEEVKPDTTLKD